MTVHRAPDDRQWPTPRRIAGTGAQRRPDDRCADATSAAAVAKLSRVDLARQPSRRPLLPAIKYGSRGSRL